MEFLRKAIRVGNSAGVLLPKSLLGSEVKVIVVKRPVNIKKETLKILEQYLGDLLGIYITNQEPLEILAISTNLRKIIQNEKIKISLVPLSLIKKDIKIKTRLRAKLFRAETILNKFLLAELKKQIRAQS